MARALRLATFNIHHGVGADGLLDLERVASAIEETEAEVVGLQEVDRNWGARSGYVDQPTWLAGRLGMQAVYGANVDLDPPAPGMPRRQYGMATLSALPVRSSVHTPLVRPLGGEQRGLLEIGVDVGDQGLRVLNTHLEYGFQVERLEQAAAIADAVRNGPAPVVLLGDLNAGPSSPEVARLHDVLSDAWAMAGVGDGFTFDAVSPHVRIDYVLVGDGVTVRSARVVPTHASDHRPLVVDAVLDA
ncbi:MAG TPA: endonuclease/exonuclease/phosphatase family protein [Jiangellaceae bacterium]|nr:endonuclease/exonuclease/phosphatase family protein [Jiangellaceae bacterium]